MSGSDAMNRLSDPAFTRYTRDDDLPPHNLTYYENLLHSLQANEVRTREQRHSPDPLESYFDDAFRPSPSPPPSFLDTILNPIEPSFLHFGYDRPPSPSRNGLRSPLPSNPPPPSIGTTPMPNMRPARLPNGYVDLTSEPEPTSERVRKRTTPTPGPSSKRLKRTDGAAVPQVSKSPEAKIEEIDLSDERSSIRDVLQKQRADAVKSQQKPEEKATTFKNFTCVICMDTPTDLTATSCGHLFCHTCLMEALIAGENRSGPNEPKRSQCPVCRKFINRAKPNDIIPLLLMKGLATQPRKSSMAKLPKGGMLKEENIAAQKMDPKVEILDTVRVARDIPRPNSVSTETDSPRFRHHFPRPNPILRDARTRNAVHDSIANSAATQGPREHGYRRARVRRQRERRRRGTNQWNQNEPVLTDDVIRSEE